MSDVDSTPPTGPTPDSEGMPPAPASFPAPGPAAQESIVPPGGFPPPGGAAYPPPAGPPVGPPSAYPQPPYQQPSYPQGYPQQGYPLEGYPQPGASQQGYPPPSYPTQPYPAQGYQPPPAPYAGQPPYPYPGQPYSPPTSGAVAPSNTSAIILLVISILAILATGIIGPPSGVMAVMSMKRNATDPARAAGLATRGWITFAINAVLGLFAIVALFWWLANNR